MAYVPELDAMVEIWRDEERLDGTRRRARPLAPDGHPYATALDALCAIAGVTPRETWVRELSARAVAADQPSL
jgi:hypothetical protein